MRKKIAVLILIAYLLMLTACSQDKTNASASYEGTTLIDNAEKVSEHRMENVIKKGSEKLPRFYSEEFIKLQNDPVVDELNDLYKVYIQNLVDQEEKEELITEVDVLFYGDSIKEYKEKKLSFEDLLANPSMHIKRASIQLHMFRKAPKLTKFWFKADLKDVYTPLVELWSDYHLAEVDYINILWSVYDEDILDEISLEDLENQENKILYMDQYKSCLARFVLDERGFDSYKDGILSNQEDLDYLAIKTERKYQEPFVGIINAGKKGKSYAAPSRDMSLVFELNGTDKDEYERYDLSQDRYVALVMYKHVYSEIERILEKYELTEMVLPILHTTDGNIDIITTEVKIDEIEDWPLFMEETFRGSLQITLNVLQSRESLDEVVLYDAAREIQNILSKEYFDENDDMDLMIYFYGDIDNRGKEMANRIFKNAHKTTNMNFIDKGSLSTIFDRLYTNYTYDDWFKYLSTYYTREPGHIIIGTLVEELSPETFLDRYKRDELL